MPGLADRQDNIGQDAVRRLFGAKRVLSCALALIVFLIPLAGASRSPAAPAEVTEFPLAVGSFYPGQITAGPDGNLWFALTRGLVGQPAYNQHYETLIDRIAPSGQIAEFQPPSPGASAITAGPDDAVWYLSEGHVGRVTSAGQFTEFPLARPFAEGPITTGPDGNLWTTKRDDTHTDAIVRVTPSGQVSTFPLPKRESGPRGITPGPDGNLWFTESFGHRIGRITPSGHITEFPVSSTPGEITSGPDGNLWFTDGVGIGRITPSGRLTEFPLKEQAFGSIAAGPDGRIWFLQGLGRIGRITPSGRVTQVKLPSPETYVADIAPGPEGAVWYTAVRDHPCEGGGVTCQMFIPETPGTVGRIMPSPLGVAIEAARPRVSHGRVKVRLACEGGDADSVCRGTIRLGTPGIALASARYRLFADEARPIALPLRDRALALLTRRRHLRVTVTAGSAATGRVRESIVLRAETAASKGR